MSTLAGDFWICGQCRSINNAGARQCYNCRTPRDRAAVDVDAIDPASHGPLKRIELPEFTSSRWAAVLASILILTVAVLQVAQFNLARQIIDQLLAGVVTTNEQVVYVGTVGIVAFGITLLALIAWALWLSRTVRAMPALGLGYPPTNGLMAFVENFIPIFNLFRVPAIVRDVVRRLDPTTGRGQVLIFAAWISLIGGWLLPYGLGFFVDDVRTAVAISGLGTALMVVGAIFMVVVIWWVERHIRARRDVQLAEASAEAAVAPAPAEATSDVAIAAAATDAVASRSAFAAVASSTSEGVVSFRLPAAEAVADVAPPIDEPTAADTIVASDVASTDAPEAVAAAEAPTAADPPAPPDVLQPIAAAAPAAPHESGDAGPPNLTLRISTRGMLTAEMDGEIEHVMLDDLGPYAEALSDVGGSATIHIPTDEGMPALIGKRAQKILEDAGVSVTLA